MKYDPGIKVLEKPDVYPPSEDSILLIESLDITPGETVLELGCGSGVVSLHMAAAGAIVTAGDINPSAVKLTSKNAKLNGLAISTVITDVFDSVEGKYDTVVFNLPYLPVDDDVELAEAWSGGPDGLRPLPRILKGMEKHGNKRWRVVVVVSSLADKEKLNKIMRDYNVKVIGKLPLFFEKLKVLEITL